MDKTVMAFGFDELPRDALEVLLTDAKALKHRLAHRYMWTQGASARNRAGQSVPACDKAATCWCLGGAMEKVLWDARDRFERGDRYSMLWKTISVSITQCGFNPQAPSAADIVWFNDFLTRDFFQIHQVLDFAILRIRDEIAARP